MPNTTRANLPYPVGTDKVRAGASAIQALATAVDAGVVTVVPLHLAADLIDTYPGGVTYFSLTGAQAAADPNWPAGVSSQVWTFKPYPPSADRIVQFWYRNSIATPDFYYRSGGATGWSAWAHVTGGDYASMAATSSVNVGNNTFTVVSPGTVESQAGSAVTGDASGIVVNTPGLYHINGMIQWAGTAAGGRRMIGFGTHNDSSGPNVNWRSAGYFNDGSAYNQTYGDTVYLAAGDIGRISMWAHQLSGAVIAITNRRFVIRKAA